MDELVCKLFDVSTHISDIYYMQIMDLLKQIHDNIDKFNGIKYFMEINGDDIYNHMVNGKVHMIGYPARITIRNNKVICLEWYKDDKLHREDGPARTMVE